MWSLLCCVLQSTAIAPSTIAVPTAEAAHGTAAQRPRHGDSTVAPGVPVIEIVPAGGPLVDQLKRQADSAAAHGQIVLVVIGTPECGLCLAFQHTLSDPVMVQSLKAARVVHINYNIWSTEIAQQSLFTRGDGALPELFLLTRNGGEGESFDKTLWSAYGDSVHATTTAQAYGPPLRAFVLAALEKTK